MRPHRRQPIRLHHPWDSPGKNTGAGCHFLLQCMKVKSESEVAQSCLTLATPWTAAHQAPPSMGFSRQKYWSGLPLPSPKYSLGFRKVSSELSFTILPGELWLTTKFLAGMKHVQFLTSCVPFDNHIYAYSFFFSCLLTLSIYLIRVSLSLSSLTKAPFFFLLSSFCPL